MMYVDEHIKWLANWSQYGDWNASVKRLSTRDPIWQAQVESEANVHTYTGPLVIQDVWFSCHGEMGERQLKVDIMGLTTKPAVRGDYKRALNVNDAQIKTSNPHSCTDVFYATVPGILSEKQRGKAYPFNKDCAPIAGISVKDNPQLYAKYGSLARDGVSCETCHRMGPKTGKGKWDGTSYKVFYGVKHTYHVDERQTANPVPLEYEFTATFDSDMSNIIAPDAVEKLDTVPMTTGSCLADSKDRKSWGARVIPTQVKWFLVSSSAHLLMPLNPNSNR